MPARRFFAMLRAAQRIKIKEKLDSIDFYAIPLTTGKYCDDLRDSLCREMDLLNGFDPGAMIDEPKDMTDEERSNVHMGLMEVLATRRRVNGV
jgi:hypothetical protein